MFSIRLIYLATSVLLIAAGGTHLNAQPIASKSDISSFGSGEKETSLGDLTADALRSATGTDMAFVPSSALRQVDLSASGLQSSEFEDCLVATTAPGNAFVSLHLKGRQVLAALERSVSRLPQTFDGFLQISGIKVVYDPTKPQGSRIVSVILANGQPISPDSQYTAAMTQPLGIGGMGYFQAWNQSDIDKTSDTALSTAVVSFAIAHQPLNVDTDGRLTAQ